MIRSLWMAVLALGVMGCGDADAPLMTPPPAADASLPDRSTTDGISPDQHRVPHVIAIVPEQGSATGNSPAFVTGENLAAGSTVYVDGGQVIVSTFGGEPPYALRFTMPPNPYGTQHSTTVSIMVLSDGRFSNPVDYRYVK